MTPAPSQERQTEKKDGKEVVTRKPKKKKKKEKKETCRVYNKEMGKRKELINKKVASQHLQTQVGRVISRSRKD